MRLKLFSSFLVYGEIYHPMARRTDCQQHLLARRIYNFREGQIFITSTANELPSNNLVNLEPALVFLLKFPVS